MEKSKKTIKKVVKTPKTLELVQFINYMTGKLKFVGLKNGEIVTRSFNSKTMLLYNNPKFRKAFDKGELKLSKITNIKR